MQSEDVFSSLFNAAKRKWRDASESNGDSASKVAKKAKAAGESVPRPAVRSGKQPGASTVHVKDRPKLQPAFSARDAGGGGGQRPGHRPPQQPPSSPPRKQPKPAPKAEARREAAAAPAEPAAEAAFGQREKRDRSREKERKQKRKERLRLLQEEGGPAAEGAAAAAAEPGPGAPAAREGKRQREDAPGGARGGGSGEALPAKQASGAGKQGKKARPGVAAGPGGGVGGSERGAGGAAGTSGRPSGGAGAGVRAKAKESRQEAEARADADSAGKAARARQQRMLSAIRSRGEGSWGAEDEGDGEGGGSAPAGAGGDAGGEKGAGSNKLSKKLKARQALLLKPEVVTPADKSGLSFDAEWHDHCETPFEAYQHIEPLLFKLAQFLGKTKEQLRIYDPYFCEGSMVKHLGRLGFTNVYNRNEDFYAVVERGLVPEHDVLVTNPPYSADHMQRCLRFCMANGRPWLLCLPNFVYRKRDYQSILGEARSPGPGPRTLPRRPERCRRYSTGVVPFYLCPPRRYVYYAPGRQQERTQATSPFDSFWYCYLEPCGLEKEQVASWFENKYAKVSGCRIARTPADLPEDVVPVRLDKRPNPKARRRAQKRAAFIHKQFGVPMKHIRGGPKDDRG